MIAAPRSWQVIAGTAGVPPAMSAEREQFDTSTLIGNAPQAGGTPAVPAIHLMGCGGTTPQLNAIYTSAKLTPPIVAPESVARTPWSLKARWSKFCAEDWKDWDQSTVPALASSFGLSNGDIELGLLKLRSGRLCDSRPVHARGSETRMVRSAGCWRVFTATRSTVCGRKSNRSRPPISCAICSPGKR
mgnify:CR=1 FL=1